MPRGQILSLSYKCKCVRVLSFCLVFQVSFNPWPLYLFYEVKDLLRMVFISDKRPYRRLWQGHHEWGFHIRSDPWWLRGWRHCLQCGRPELDPWVRKIPWRRKWQHILHSCLKNPMDGGTCWATVHRVTESVTWVNSLFLSRRAILGRKFIRNTKIWKTDYNYNFHMPACPFEKCLFTDISISKPHL